MSRRKQARPIRVLESEEGSSTIAEMVNGEGSSEAESASGGSLSESEDEDAARKHSPRHRDQESTGRASSASPISDGALEALARYHTRFNPDQALRTTDENFTRGRNEYDEMEDGVGNATSQQEMNDLQSTLCQLQRQQMMQISLIQQLQQQFLNKHSTRSSSPVESGDTTAMAGDNALRKNNNRDKMFQLQHQQLLQISLIQQLQQQIQFTRPSTRSSSPVQQCDMESVSPNDNNNNNSGNVPMGLPLVVTRTSSPLSLALATPKPSRTPTPVKHERSSVSPAASQPLIATGSYTAPKLSISPPIITSQPVATMPPCSISSSFASSIITNLDPPPSPSEPNSLEMLKKRTQEVLENASQGLLANNLADDLAFRKNGANGKGSSLSPYDSKSGGRNEPFFKHRCRYCGKVFGSDSALQIHIRSHTGERPFKCNVCGSRFTTKGNLKVHFQRHTQKFPHVKMNPNPIPEHLDKLHPPLLAQVNNNQVLTPAGLLASHPTLPLLDRSGSPYAELGMEPSDDLSAHFRGHSQKFPYLKMNPTPGYHPLLLTHHPTLSPAILGPHPSLPLLDRGGSPFGRDSNEDQRSEPEVAHNARRASSEGSLQEEPENLASHSHHSQKSPPMNMISSPSGSSGRASSSAAEMHMSVDSPDGSNEDQHSQHSQHSGHSTGRDSQQEPENLSNKMRGNTTCNICYKTFACNSALEIHYRSHTKERPYKCSVCDRGFSTKGNMKQHLLTHKIRDMPTRMMSTGSLSMPSSLVDETSNTSTESKDTIPSSAASMRCLSLDPQPSTSSSLSPTQRRPVAPAPIAPSLPVPPPPPPSVEPLVLRAPRRSSPDSDQSGAPAAKRQSTSPKHLCLVCNKNFSSSSALQIHMRTHTGDKPFQCTICMKAFTTKGNLKVHMGTHMWNNGASRRGRRMSLELPVPQIPVPQDAQAVEAIAAARRNDFAVAAAAAFYNPYAPPAAFLANGLNRTVGASLTNGLFRFGGVNNLRELNRPASPMSPPLSLMSRHLGGADHQRPPTSRAPWGLHFERASGDDHMDVSPPSPPHPPPQGAGVAASV